MLTDDGQTNDGVTGILLAHLGAFGSGELKSLRTTDGRRRPITIAHLEPGELKSEGGIVITSVRPFVRHAIS